jgi:adenine-specific DNA-methyltransferase
MGDNLSAMRLLLEDPEVRGKVDLVYIDPPFGTGRRFELCDGRVAYDDTLKGQGYLDFLRPRLELLRGLMAEGGSIYVHVDCKVGHRVRVIMDEVFGASNFRNDITRVKCNPKNFKRYGYGNTKDVILFYTMGKSATWNHPHEPFTDEELRRLYQKVDAHGRRYTTTPLHAPGETRDGPSGQPWNGLKPPAGRHWRCPPDELTRLDEEGLIERSAAGNPRKRLFADEAIARGRMVQDVWVFKDPQAPLYPTEKNLDMLRRIVGASSNVGDLVLDCFCGSGGTLVAAEESGRRWIGIDSSQTAMSVCEWRLINEVVRVNPDAG